MKLKKLLISDFARSSMYSAISALVKIVSAFAMSKIIALYLGPQGMGLVGQLNSFILIVLVLAGGGVSNGVVKFVSEYNSSSREKLPGFISTAFKTVLFLGFIVGVLLVLFSSFFSHVVFLTDKYRHVFIIFGFTVLFYGLNNLLLSIVNGFKDFARYNLVNIVTSVVGLAISFVCIYTMNVEGAFIALVINQSVVFFIGLLFFLRKDWFTKETFFQKLDTGHLAKLGRFALMTLVTTAVVPVSQLYLRNYIIRSLSLFDAGIWESVNRISNVYLLFITTTLTTYYLPRLSELQLESEIRAETRKVFRVVVPAVLVCSTAIYFCRSIIINVLFTASFEGAETLFLFQMLGDVFKVAAWLLAFQMVAKMMTKLFIVTEILFGIMFTVISVLFVQQFGLVGTTYAYALNYFLYLVLMIIVFKRFIL